MEVNEFTLLVESQSAAGTSHAKLRCYHRDAPEELKSGFAAEVEDIFN